MARNSSKVNEKPTKTEIVFYRATEEGGFEKKDKNSMLSVSRKNGGKSVSLLGVSNKGNFNSPLTKSERS
jgi:hypothetical protein